MDNDDDNLPFEDIPPLEDNDISDKDIINDELGEIKIDKTIDGEDLIIYNNDDNTKKSFIDIYKEKYSYKDYHINYLRGKEESRTISNLFLFNENEQMRKKSIETNKKQIDSEYKKNEMCYNGCMYIEHLSFPKKEKEEEVIIQYKRLRLYDLDIHIVLRDVEIGITIKKEKGTFTEKYVLEYGTNKYNLIFLNNICQYINFINNNVKSIVNEERKLEIIFIKKEECFGEVYRIEDNKRKYISLYENYNNKIIIGNVELKVGIGKEPKARKKPSRRQEYIDSQNDNVDKRTMEVVKLILIEIEMTSVYKGKKLTTTNK
jgi:hypothetical protein